jgi:hypothetical protein
MIYNPKIISSYGCKFEYNLYILGYIICMHYGRFIRRILSFQNMVTPRLFSSEEKLESVNEELGSLEWAPPTNLNILLFYFLFIVTRFLFFFCLEASIVAF